MAERDSAADFLGVFPTVGSPNLDGTHRYYHADSLGSTRVVTDDVGSPVSAYSYDAYGAVKAQAGEGKAFTYTGEQTDTETSMVFLRARTYDPQTGRFLSRDSVVLNPNSSQDYNRYAYGRGNPAHYVDPSGRAAEDLQYLVPGWYDRTWHDDFVNHHGYEPQAVDYVNRYVTMALANSLNREDVMRQVVIAIGAGLSPSGPGLWSQPVDQTDISKERARWHQAFPADHSGWIRSPEVKDSELFGASSGELLWGRVRIVFSDQGELGSLTRELGAVGGNPENATTYSCNLIVFTRPLDFNCKRRRSIQPSADEKTSH